MEPCHQLFQRPATRPATKYPLGYLVGCKSKVKWGTQNECEQSLKYRWISTNLAWRHGSQLRCCSSKSSRVLPCCYLQSMSIIFIGFCWSLFWWNKTLLKFRFISALIEKSAKSIDFVTSGIFETKESFIMLPNLEKKYFRLIGK